MADDDWVVPQDDWAVPDVTAGGLAKQLGTGVADTAIKALGSWGDIQGLAGRAAEGLGFDPSTGRKALHAVPVLGPVVANVPLPTSEQVGKFVGAENLPKPQNVPEEYARTLGEFAPTAVLGPGGPLRKGIETVGSALGSESAGQLARKYLPEGSEGIARVVGSLIGSAPSVVKGRPHTYPTQQELKDSAQSFYRHPAIEAVEINPSATNRLADDIIADMSKAALREKTAGQTWRTVETLRETQVAKIADIDASRQVLGDIARTGAGTTEGRAAKIAIGKIDDFLQNLKQPDLLAGNAPFANQLLRTAREDYSAYKRLQRVNNEEYRAQLNAASAHSGTNIDNALRQRMKSILVNEKKAYGYSDEELNLMERIVTGGLPYSAQNALRRVAKLASPTGQMGFHGMLAAMTLWLTTGNLAGFAWPAIGGAARLTENALARRKMRDAQEAIAMRSWLGRMTPPRQPSELPEASIPALIRAQLAARESREGNP